MSSKSQNTFICWDLSIRSMLDRTMMTEIELTNFIGYIVGGVFVRAIACTVKLFFTPTRLPMLEFTNLRLFRYRNVQTPLKPTIQAK